MIASVGGPAEMARRLTTDIKAAVALIAAEDIAAVRAFARGAAKVLLKFGREPRNAKSYSRKRLS